MGGPTVLSVCVGLIGDDYDVRVSPSIVVTADGDETLDMVAVTVSEDSGACYALQFATYDEAERFGQRVVGAVRARRRS